MRIPSSSTKPWNLSSLRVFRCWSTLDTRKMMVPTPTLSGTCPPRQSRFLAVWLDTDYYIFGKWNLDGDATAWPNPITTDKFPTSTCPFYTMPNQENPSYSTPTISSPGGRFFLAVGVSTIPSSSRRRWGKPRLTWGDDQLPQQF